MSVYKMVSSLILLPLRIHRSFHLTVNKFFSQIMVQLLDDHGPELQSSARILEARNHVTISQLSTSFSCHSIFSVFNQHSPSPRLPSSEIYNLAFCLLKKINMNSHSMLLSGGWLPQLPRAIELRFQSINSKVFTLKQVSSVILGCRIFHRGFPKPICN